MSGHFHKIVGKTISGVYCRGNEVAPRGQVILVFDDGSYFEMYSPECEIKGIKSLGIGGMDKVLALNYRRGKETFRSPNISMWYPLLKENIDKRAAMAVPSDVLIRTYSDYWALFVTYLQNLIDSISEDEARQLIEHYLIEGSGITNKHNPHDWGEMICNSDEMDLLLAEIMDELDKELCLDWQQQEKLNENNHQTDLEYILKAIRFAFDITDEDLYVLNKIDDLVVESIKNQRFSPGDIVSIGKFLYVLRALPYPVPGASFDVSFSPKYNHSVSLQCSISDTRVSFMYGGSDNGDTFCFLDGNIDINGSREVEGEVRYLEDDYLRSEGIDMHISDESGEEITLWLNK